MPKTKKKKGSQAIQNKQLHAQQKNEYLNKLRRTFIAISGEDIFKLIPTRDLIYFTVARIKPIQVIPKEGQNIPPKIIDSIQQMISSYMKSVMMPAELTKQPVSIADYYSTGISFGGYLVYLTEHKIGKGYVEEIVALIKKSGLDMDQHFNVLWDKIRDDIFFFLILFTNCYWSRYFSYSIQMSESFAETGLCYMVSVKTHPIEKKRFVLADNTRPGFRIGWTYNDELFEWVFVTAQQLRIKSLPEDQQIPVYIQSHAIKRLFERIDCIHPFILISHIYFSLLELKLHKENGKFLIEYKILGVKVGYLSCILTKGDLLIRTFLFITFNGTPEGKKFEDFIGFTALDTKYLKMDKLSSFMTGKLREDEKLRTIFERADCMHLVELYDQLDEFSAVHPDHSPVEMLARYLEVEKN